MNRFWQAVLLTTLVAGTLDITSAHVDQFLRSGIFPDKMFYGIAGGAIGLKRAFSGGKEIMLLGIFIHYFISFSFTLFYFVIFPFVKKLSPNKFLNGLLYAIFVQSVMTFLVMPLTAFPHSPFVFSVGVLIGILSLTVVFGLPISLMAERYYRKKSDMASIGKKVN